jgi:hypothetical protein
MGSIPGRCTEFCLLHHAMGRTHPLSDGYWGKAAEAKSYAHRTEIIGTVDSILIRIPEARLQFSTRNPDILRFCNGFPQSLQAIVGKYLKQDTTADLHIFPHSLFTDAPAFEGT